MLAAGGVALEVIRALAGHIDITLVMTSGLQNGRFASGHLRTSCLHEQVGEASPGKIKDQKEVQRG